MNEFHANPPAPHGLGQTRATHPGVLTALRARWGWAVIGVLLALVIGFAAKSRYGDRQDFTGRVLHMPLPMVETNKHSLPPTDIKTLSALVKIPASMQAVAASQRLDIPPQALADLIEVKTLGAPPSLVITLRWRGPGDGAAILNRVMDEFILRCAELRGRGVDTRAEDFKAALEICDQNLQACRERVARLYGENDVHDLAQELRIGTGDLQASGKELAQARRAEAACKVQIAEVRKVIDSLGSQSAIPAGAPAAGTRRSVRQLERLIEEERALDEARTLLTVKRREQARAAELLAKGVGSKTDVDRLDGEVAALEAKVQDNTKIQQLKKELDELERAGEVPPLLQQAYSKKLDLDIQLLALSGDVPALKSEFEAKQRRVEQLLKLQAEVTPLVQQIDRGEAERLRLQTHIDQLRILRAKAGGEVTIDQPAATVARPLDGARGWLVPVAVGCAALLLWLAALVVRYSPDGGGTSESIAAEVGLPILAQLPSRRSTVAGPDDPAVRSLALSLRQRLPQAGTAVLFTPVRGGARAQELLLHTAATLARRDERVLILNAVLPGSTERECSGCRAEASTCRCNLESFGSSHHLESGLSNYLAFEVGEPAEIVQPTAVFGVDYLPAGTAVISPDMLATHRMRELLELLRQTYTIILVAGPPVGEATDVQILAAYQDGAIVLLDASSPIPAATQELLRTYRRTGIPLLGCVDLAG